MTLTPITCILKSPPFADSIQLSKKNTHTLLHTLHRILVFMLQVAICEVHISYTISQFSYSYKPDPAPWVIMKSSEVKLKLTDGGCTHS